MLGRKMLVAIAQVVLAELAAHITLLLEQVCNSWRPVRNAVFGSRHPNGKQAGPEWVLPEDERCAPRRAALLRVGVREERAFLCDAIDIGSPIAHDAVVVSADVVHANVVAPDYKDVRFVLLCHSSSP